jgi:hypothetical protein
MYNLEAIQKYNGTTKADIEGGSFQIVDGIRVPIFTGVAGEQIDSLADLQREDALDEAREVQAEQDCRRANPADGGYDEDQ